MPTPPKPLALVRKHLTNDEKKVRKDAEASSVTGKLMAPTDEVISDKAALKEFNRIKELYALIGKDDDMQSAMICRYCILRSEELHWQSEKKRIDAEMKKLEKAYSEEKLDALNYFTMTGTLRTAYLACDREVMRRRKMMYEHERESLLTLASVLRSIPKKAPETEESPMDAFLNRKKKG